MTSSENETDAIRPSSFIERVLSILDKIWAILVQFRFVIVIGLLAFWVKVAYISSIDMWDEGWFVAIANRMAIGLSDPFLPLYYRGNDNPLQFFDKPPVAFWGGAILMNIFGRTTFAAKGIVILGGAGLALIVYFLYSHQSENKSAAVIAGLLVALAHFLTFYSRTAYIDPFVVFMGALVMLLAIRAIDAVLVENNLKKGYILLFITASLNILNILTKAWQGILTFPAIGIYLVFRYIERHIELGDLQAIWKEIRSRSSLSTKDMNPNLVVHPNFFKSGVPLPLLISFIPLSVSFLSSFVITQLFVSSLITSVIIAIGFYIVFLRYCIKHNEQLRVPGIVSGIISGILVGIIGGFIVSIFYYRLDNSFVSIANAFGEEDVFSGGFFGGILSSSETILSNKSLALFVLELIAVLFGAVIAFGLVFLITGVFLDFLTNERNFLKVIYHGLDIIPLVILGTWFGFWFAGILLLGFLFDRDARTITLFGVYATVFLIPVVLVYPGIKNRIIGRFNLNLMLKSSEELSIFKSHLFFLGFAIILVIISFYPFVAWVQYLDSNIASGVFPWNIRVPGELAVDPEKPNPVTYSFLFFEYYISWRYSHATKYALPESIGSALNDYTLIVMLPFFVVGIGAFFLSTKRNPALGSALIAWLVTVPFVFFPAQFQLNYYYIPLAIPYFAIAAKGLEYIYSSKRWRITVDDNIERILAGGYFYIEIGLLYVFLPIIGLIDPLFNLISGSADLNTFLIELDNFGSIGLLAVIFLVPFTFFAFRVLKTFPGIITTGFAYKFFIISWIKEENIGKLYSILFHDLLDTILSLDLLWTLEIIELGAPVATLFGIILLIFGLHWLKPKVKPQVFVILGLTLSAMLINVSATIHGNQIYDLRFQEIAIYIKNHGGDYNYSTWVIPEAGAQFAMRYYLGYEVVDPGYDSRPISFNSTSAMENYYQNHNYTKFWVVINNSKHWDVPAYAINYSAAYSWFTTHEHLVCVDDIVGLTSWYKLHLFVNRTWITEQNYDWNILSG